MQFSCVVMIVFETVDLHQGLRVGLSQSRKERFFLIRRVALSASPEVLQRSPDRIAFLIGKAPALCSINHDTEDAKEALDASVAVLEHADRVVKTAIGLCANLNCHGVPLLLPRSYCRPFRGDRGAIRAKALMKPAPGASARSSRAAP